MKLCIPVDADRGMDSPVSAHFGQSPFYVVVDTETTEHRVIANRNPHFYGGDCHPMTNLANEPVDAFLVRSIGMRALARLQAAGIEVRIVDSASLADSIAAYRAGQLRSATMDAACPSGDGRPADPNSPFEHGSCCHSC
jgi:predicted Fe-Mo cluster-binding NifX family protein